MKYRSYLLVLLCMSCSCDTLHSTKWTVALRSVDMASHEIPVVLVCACFVHLILCTLRSGLSPFAGVDMASHDIPVVLVCVCFVHLILSYSTKWPTILHRCRHGI